MTRLPYIEYTGNQRLRTTGQFGGFNNQLVVADNEFSDMENISCRFYPAIGSREKRGVVQQTIQNCKAMYHKNGLFYISGTRAYYKGTQVGTVTDTEKQIVGMAAYIIIFPDKVVFNTATGEWKQMEKTFVPSGATQFRPFSEGSAFTIIQTAGIDTAFNQYDGVVISGCQDNQFNTTKIVTEIGSGYIVVTGVLDENTQFTQASGLTFKRSVPDMDYICEANNRLWGCSNEKHEIYGSKLGDPLNFNCFEGISTDSYTVTIGSDGDFTGCIGHLGYVLFFKEQTIHKLYGAKPSVFQMNAYKMEGVKAGCDKSLEIINETLLYVGRNGVYTYDGSTPYLISKNFGTLRLQDAIASQQNSKYYVSASDGLRNRLYVFDPETQIWDIEDSLRFAFADYAEGKLWYVDTAGKLATITGERDEEIEWYLESGDIVENSIRNKYVSKLLFNFWLERGALATIYIRWDEDKVWERKGEIKAEWNKTYSLPIIPRRCSKFRYRIEGKGEFKLLALGRYNEEGSEISHGVIKH